MRISDWSSDVCSSDLYWFKGAQGGGFGWLAGVLIALAMVCLSVVAFIASLLLHPWEQSSFFDRRVQEDPKAQLEQWYPNCRAKRLTSGKWLLNSKEPGNKNRRAAGRGNSGSYGEN